MEFEYYRYPENKTDLNEKETPEKVNDHMMDAIGDLNSYYDHHYDVKTDPFKNKIPGTFHKPYDYNPDETDTLDEEIDFSKLW